MYILNPTKHDCEHYFEYEQDGTIKPNLNLSVSEVRKAANTITVFNLDNLYLRKARIDAYKRANELLESVIESGMKLEDVFEDINQMNDGKLDPYCLQCVALHQGLIW